MEESLNGNSHAFIDNELGWKLLFLGDQTSALTLYLIGIIPSGNKKSSVLYGKFGGQVSLLYSKAFDLARFESWYDLELGYRYYDGYPSDQIRLNLAVGSILNSYFTLIGSSQLQYGLWNGKSDGNLNNIAFHPNYRLLKGQLECVVHSFRHVFVSFGAYRHFWGQNVGGRRLFLWCVDYFLNYY